MRNSKVYSGLAMLPRGKASNTYTDGCLALEGGAFRGLYTSGVLDFLMKKGINFSTTVGVSAGALNGMNYVSGDIGRSALTNLKYRHDQRWVGLTALRTDHGIMGFDFLLNGLEGEYPFDREHFSDPAHRLVAVATNLQTGMPEYFDSRELDFSTMFRAVAASASMPFVTKPVTIGSSRYLDGGCSTKLPIRWALEQDFQKIVLVTTNECTYRRKEKTEQSFAAKTVYHKCPQFREACTRNRTVYNEDAELADRMVESGRIFRIAPSEPVTVSRLEGDMEKLGALYRLGYDDASREYNALITYLLS